MRYKKNNRRKFRKIEMSDSILIHWIVSVNWLCIGYAAWRLNGTWNTLCSWHIMFIDHLPIVNGSIPLDPLESPQWTKLFIKNRRTIDYRASWIIFVHCRDSFIIILTTELIIDYPWILAEHSFCGLWFIY